MLNEDYVREIQAGNEEHLAELWAGVRNFVAKKAVQKMRAYRLTNTDTAVDVDDLIQEGFIAMLEAAGSFQADRGMSFIGWLDLFLKTAFNDALGLRRQRDLHDPIHQRESLSRTIQPDEDGGTLEEWISDGGAAVHDMERAVWRDQLRPVLELNAARLPPAAVSVLFGRFWLGLTVQQIAEAEGVSHQAVSGREVRALRRMRRNDTAGVLAEFAGQL